MNPDSPLWATPRPLLDGAYGLADASCLDPLVDAEIDFDRAQITIVYVRQTDTNERTMLLGVVELLTPWTESGPEIPRTYRDQAACLRQPTAHSEINVRRVVRPVCEGLDWYGACRSGSVVLPATKEEQQRSEADKRVGIGPLSHEPAWPRLVAGRYDERAVDLPLLGSRPGGARTHHSLSATPPALSEWNEAERQNARQWLQRWLHWDLFGRPLLLGSAHLIVTNPLFRELHVRLAGGGQRDVVFLRIEPLPGRSTETLVATVEEIRPYGPATSCAVPLTSRSTEVRLGYEPHLIKVDVYCTRRGLLLSHGPFAFLTSVALNMGLGSGERIVNVPEREGRPTTYKVSTARFENRAIVGTTRPADARAVAAQDVAEVLTLRSASSLGQQVFMRNVGEAESTLRSLIGTAQQSVCIVDPYLGPTELLVFGLANGNLDVRVEILTSAEFLRDKRQGDIAAKLLSTVEQLKGKPLVGPIEVRVARGKRSPVHDRFVVIDGRVWLVGSSLSELGSRGTVIVQLSDPAPVRALIQQVWENEATSIRDFVENRLDDEGESA